MKGWLVTMRQAKNHYKPAALELNILLADYKAKYPADIEAQKFIRAAATFANCGDTTGIHRNIKQFNGNMLDIAQAGKYTVLPELIIKYFK